jgi:hypothetical protein
VAPRLGGADASLEGPWRPRVLDLKRCGDDAWFKLAMS